MKNELFLVNEATLRLFKSLLVVEGGSYRPTTDDIVRLTEKGIILDPKLTFLTETETTVSIKNIIDIYGKDIIKISNTFHKTWKTVEEINPELHYLQQIIHYITTYGYDSLGISYDENNAYIPNEKVELPEGVKPFSFIVIKALNIKELHQRVNNLLSSGVALSQQQIDDIYLLINTCELPINFDEICNKEVRALLWPNLSNKPYISVDEFLRVLTCLVTGQTLLIRSYRQYQTIKLHLKYDENKQQRVATLLNEYISNFGIENIASQFLRNKMLFLSFKCDTTKSLINKIRRVADKYHKPSSNDVLSYKDIERANIWQLFKYYNLCISNLNPTKDKLYQVRNGLSYLKENGNFGVTGQAKILIEDHYKGLLEVISNKIKDELSFLKDKTLYIPDYIEYKVPTSLKRLVEGIPEGSSVTFPENTSPVIGIHWTNLPGDSNQVEWDEDEYGDSEYYNTSSKKCSEHRVDLDLHINSLDHQGGWCYSYRENDSFLFTGDMTDAPISKGGASEAYLFKNPEEAFIVTLNDYTGYKEVPYKLIFDFNFSNYEMMKGSYPKTAYGNIFSPNLKALNCKIGDQRQLTLGLVFNNKLYFTTGSIFSGPVTSRSELLLRLLDYYKDSQANSLTLNQLADIVGFNIISEKDEDINYTDLSLEAITIDTFPSLFTNPEEGDPIE